MLEEHQSVLELIMNKYRQQVKKINETTKAEKAWAQKDFSLVIKVLFLRFVSLVILVYMHALETFYNLECVFLLCFCTEMHFEYMPNSETLQTFLKNLFFITTFK